MKTETRITQFIAQCIYLSQTQTDRETETETKRENNNCLNVKYVQAA